MSHSNGHGKARVREVDPGDTGLPSRIDWERFVLGTSLVNPGDYEAVSAVLSPPDFFLRKHQLMFSAIAELAKRGLPLDYATLGCELMQRKQLDAIDGLSYLAELTEGMPPIVPANLLKWCAGIKEASVRRKGLAVAQVMSNRLLTDPATGVDEILSAGVERVQGLRGQVSGGSLIESLPPPGASTEGVSYVIDPELPEGAVVAFTGAAGAGKSTLVTAYAREALARGRRVLVLDRENPEHVVVQRLRSLAIDPAHPDLKWWGGWNQAQAPFADHAEVVAFFKACEKPGVLIVDNLGAFHGGDENEAGEMRAFFGPLRRLADMGVCVITLHNTGKSETAKEYRGSSAFNDCLDQGIFVSNVSADGRLDKLILKCFKSRFDLNGTNIVYRYDDGRFTKDERNQAGEIVASERLTSILRSNPGIAQARFENLAVQEHISRVLARQFLSDGTLGGLIRRERQARNRFCYFLVGL